MAYKQNNINILAVTLSAGLFAVISLTACGKKEQDEGLTSKETTVILTEAEADKDIVKLTDSDSSETNDNNDSTEEVNEIEQEVATENIDETTTGSNTNGEALNENNQEIEEVDSTNEEVKEEEAEPEKELSEEQEMSQETNETEINN